MINWQRNEIRCLNNIVEELERRLRWRTITIGSALALSMLTAVAAAGWVVALLYRDNPGAMHAMLATPSAEQVVHRDNLGATHATLAAPGSEQVTDRDHPEATHPTLVGPGPEQVTDRGHPDAMHTTLVAPRPEQVTDGDHSDATRPKLVAPRPEQVANRDATLAAPSPGQVTDLDHRDTTHATTATPRPEQVADRDKPDATPATLAVPRPEQVTDRDHPDATPATLATPGAEQVAGSATSAEGRLRATNSETAAPLGEPGAAPFPKGNAGQAAQLSTSEAERALDALIKQATPGDAAAQTTSMRFARLIEQLTEAKIPADEGAPSPPSASAEASAEAPAERTEISHQASASEPAAATAAGQHEPTPPEAGRWGGAGLGDAWGAEYYVSTAPVNLRTAPASEAASLAVVPEGDLVKMIGRKRNWLNVEYSHAGAESVTGWVYSDYLRRTPRPEEDGP